MRFAAAYYLLLLYCMTIIRCAIPIVCDELSHLCNEEKHIATVHANYGSQHVQAEISSIASDNNANKSILTFQNEPTATHIFTTGYFCSAYSKVITAVSFSDRMCSSLLYQATEIIIPPPERLSFFPFQ